MQIFLRFDIFPVTATNNIFFEYLITKLLKISEENKFFNRNFKQVFKFFR